jgi:hypothetical protein
VIILGGFILGVVVGAATALRRGGRKLDALQYAAVFGIIFALIGLFIDIYLGHVL